MKWKYGIFKPGASALCGLVGSGMVFNTAAQMPRNILFIGTDDLRTDLGCYGKSFIKTPNLDRLAAQGVLFERAYCQQALCNPSRCSLLTGRRPDRLQVWNLTAGVRRDPAVVTLPQRFKAAGYFAQDIGKIYHNWKQEGHVDYPQSWSVPPVYHIGAHGDDKPVIDGPLPPDFAKNSHCECRDVPDEAYFDGRIAADAVSALKGFAANPDQPFFLAVGFWKPHLPFNAPKKYWDLYSRDQLPEVENPLPPANVPEIALTDSWELFRGKPNNLSPADVQELRHGYWACISYLDAQVGKLMDALEESGLADHTIIVFWSDHGFHLGEQSLWAKNTNFELDARAPLIISVPGAAVKGVRSASIVELIDMYPTLLDLCGMTPPAGLQGSSLVPVLNDPSVSVKDAAYTQHPRPAYYQGKPESMGYSVRTGMWRYTEWIDSKTGAVTARELYDHRHGDVETENLAVNPEYSPVCKELSVMLDAYRIESTKGIR